MLDSNRSPRYRAHVLNPIEPIYRALGAIVRERRQSKRWSQDQLGRSLHPPVTRASVANLEAGQQRVLLHTAVELASILDFSLAQFRVEHSVDTRSLAEELASKLQIPETIAQSLASHFTGKDSKP